MKDYKRIFLPLIILYVGFGIVYYPFFWVSQYSKPLELGLLVLFSGIWLLLKNPFRNVFIILLIVFFSIDFGIQTLYFRAFGQFGSIATLLTIHSEATQNIASIVEFIRVSDIRFILAPLTAILLLTFNKESKSSFKVRKRFSLILIMIGCLGVSLYYYNVQQSRLEYDDFLYYKSDHYIYTVVPNTNSFVTKFGLLGWTIRDVDRTLVSPLFANDTNENSQITTLLSSREATAPIGNFHGIFEGKSLLLIEAESLNNFAIDPILTPNLYRLYTNGYRMDNYNSPLLFGSTSDAELMANTGLVPANDGYVTFHKYARNTFPLSLAKSFNENGYKSLAVHNNYGEFYNRDIIMPALGYEFLDCIGMGFQTQFVADSAMAETLSWIMVEKAKDYSFWITFNGHQPYNVDTLDPAYSYFLPQVQELYPDLPIGEQIYLAKNMDLDLGIYEIIHAYESQNRIDDLVIAIYGDHHAKEIFLNPDEYKDECAIKGYDLEYCTNTPFIIWNNDQFVGVNNTVSSTIDISPTLYDLFGINYNPQLMLGHSVFDPSYNGFYFDASGTIATNDFTYNLVTKELTLKSSISKEDAIAQAEKLSQELNLGHKIIENNYFETVTQ